MHLSRSISLSVFTLVLVYISAIHAQSGACGAGIGSCATGYCCSAYGYCGQTAAYCQISNGCQPAYGTCSGSSTTVTTGTTAKSATTTTTATTATTATTGTTASTTTTGSTTTTTGSTTSSNFCYNKPAGDYCDGTGYVSCPTPTIRPCPSGLVCNQSAPGVVYCIYPPSTTTSTTASTTSTTSGTTSTTATTGSTTKSATTTSSTTGTTASTTATTGSATTTTGATTTTTGTTTSGGGSWPSGGIVKAVYVDYSSYYSSNILDVLNEAINAGFNLLILGFYTGNNNMNGVPQAYDAALSWQNLGSTAQRNYINTVAHPAGVKIIVSGGGANDYPFDTLTGTQFGNLVGAFANNNNLDGADIDIEHLGNGFVAGSLTAAQTLSFFKDVFTALRAAVGPYNTTITGKLVTSAPQAPYFGGGAQSSPNYNYNQVYLQTNGIINYLFIQYYDQGYYTTCAEIFTYSGDEQPQTSLAEIEQTGVPASVLVVGGLKQDSDVPYPASFFCNCFQQITSYDKNFFLYEYENSATDAYLQEVYASTC